MHSRLQLAFTGLALVVLVGDVAAQFLGWAFAHKRLQRGIQAPVAGRGAIEASLFALLGLLLAFSFSGAQGRLIGRHDLIVREASAIDTAYLRLDLLAEPWRGELKEKLLHYVDSRISFYDARLDRENLDFARRHSHQLRQELWEGAVRAWELAPDRRDRPFVLMALNEMFNTQIAREAALRMHTPLAIFIFLALLSFACAFMAGMNMAEAPHPNALYVYLFASTMALTAFIILSIEFPLAGFMHIRFPDDPLVQLRATLR
jgi:hypothetical protein